MRFAKVLAGAAIATLCTAAPSFAADGEELPFSVSDVLETAPADSSAGAPVTPLEELVGEAQELLEAVEDETVAPEASAPAEPAPEEAPPAPAQKDESPVISGVSAADITSAAESAVPSPPAVEDAVKDTAPVAVENDAPSSADTAPVDTSSAGSELDAKAEPTGATELPAATDSDATSAQASGVGAASPNSQAVDVNDPGYHDADSQYQSDKDEQKDPWHWTWELTTDCAGNTTSSSTETGVASSLDWTWDWTWDWSCTGSRPPPIDASDVSTSTSSEGGNVNVSIRVLSPGEDGSVAQSGTPAAQPDIASADTAPPATGPWSWEWTFTFCGETRTFTTDMQSGTPLSWAWSWLWTWACDASVVPPTPEIVVETPAGTSTVEAAPAQTAPTDAPEAVLDSVIPADTGAIPPLVHTLASLPLLGPRAAPTVLPTGGVGMGLEILVEPELPTLGLPALGLPALGLPTLGLPVLEPSDLAPISSVVVEVDVPFVVTSPAEPVTTPAVPPWRLPSAADGTTDVSGGGRQAERAARPSTPPVWQPPATTSSKTSSKPSPPRHSARPASPRRDRDERISLLDPPRSSQASGGLGTTGGLVPSAPLVAVAALMSFFVLAAPGLGRRLRVARELSPRDAYRSSIDHPG